MLYLTKKMDNKKATQVRKQLSQLNEERFPKQKKEGSNDGVVREMIFDNSEKENVSGDEKKGKDQAFTKRRIAELETEIREMSLKRQQEMRERNNQEEKKEEGQENVPANIPSGKPKRGFGARRIKSAQEQAQPETAGRRVAG